MKQGRYFSQRVKMSSAMGKEGKRTHTKAEKKEGRKGDRLSSQHEHPGKHKGLIWGGGLNYRGLYLKPEGGKRSVSGKRADCFC